MPSLRSAASILILVASVLSAVDARHASPDGAAADMTTSPWLDKVYRRPRVSGCGERPWVCQAGFSPFPPFVSRMCCRNRCVDVSGDENNCGFCGVRCPFSWRCCGGVCVDPSTNPFHCGGCNNPCPFGSLCSYGMCGYAQALPAFPFPWTWRQHVRPRFPREEHPP